MDSIGAKMHEPKKLGYFNNALLIDTLDFPIYYLECISERHFIVAGGGGSSKTGVINQINILELIPTGDSCGSELIMKYHTPDEIPDAIMNGSLMKDLPIMDTRLVTGGCSAVVYYINYDAHKKTFKITDHRMLKDKQIKAEIKCVKCHEEKVFTGAVDGQLVVWDNNNKICKQIKAHTSEIDEIDIDPISQQVVTLSRGEGRCAIWDLTNLKLVYEFEKKSVNIDSPPNVKYNFRSCRYAYDVSCKGAGSSQSKSNLVISCNSNSKNEPSKLYKYSTDNLKKFTIAKVTKDGIMSMTVSSDGKFVAIGTRSGHVSILELKNLKQIYKLDGAHHNAVTRLEFLAPKPESLSLTNSANCPLLSVSIDRRIVLHRPRGSSMMSSICKSIFFALLLYILFFILHNTCLHLFPEDKVSNNRSET